jgi:hypothetical protein
MDASFYFKDFQTETLQPVGIFMTDFRLGKHPFFDWFVIVEFTHFLLTTVVSVSPEA